MKTFRYGTLPQSRDLAFERGTLVSQCSRLVIGGRQQTGRVNFAAERRRRPRRLDGGRRTPRRRVLLFHLRLEVLDGTQQILVVFRHFL